jgi:hypothetical protein
MTEAKGRVVRLNTTPVCSQCQTPMRPELIEPHQSINNAHVQSFKCGTCCLPEKVIVPERVPAAWPMPQGKASRRTGSSNSILRKTPKPIKRVARAKEKVS